MYMYLISTEHILKVLLWGTRAHSDWPRIIIKGFARIRRDEACRHVRAAGAAGGARADVWCKPENCSGKLPLLLNRTLLPKTAQTVLLDRGTYIWNTSVQNGNFDRSKNENPPPGWGSVMGAVIAGDRGTATQDPDPNSWAVTIQGKQLKGRLECKNETDIGTVIDAQDANAMFYLFGAQTLNLQCVRLVNGKGRCPAEC